MELSEINSIIGFKTPWETCPNDGMYLNVSGIRQCGWKLEKIGGLCGTVFLIE